MLIKTYGCAVEGVDAITITIEVNLSRGVQYLIVGLPDNAIKESLPRVESAIMNSDYKMPRSRIIFNLAPADLKKTGSSFDLAMAVGVLAASEQIANFEVVKDYIIMGELGLDGTIHRVKGALPMAIQAWKEGFKGIIVPRENAREAGMVNKLPVYGFSHLKEVVGFFDGEIAQKPVVVNTREDFFSTQTNFEYDFADVKGQENIKRVLEIAAAGGHNAILIGPPGSGKTMLANRLLTILPPLTLQEALETTKVYSVTGKLPDFNDNLLNKRPFRAPHHTISNIALVGGGSSPQPGEISLAHNGVLFLDELPEFNRSVLEVMRQPMEDRKVIISRAMRTLEFPSNFILVASMNPCPCGYYNHPNRECSCSAQAVQKYMSKISGPLMDRIDLHVEVSPLPLNRMNDQRPAEKSGVIRQRVMEAREIQAKRFKEVDGTHTNSQMNSTQLKEFCALDKNCEVLLFNAMERLQLSARAYDRILKVARTVADLENSMNIEIVHLAEAIQYRSLDKEQWLDDPKESKRKSPPYGNNKNYPNESLRIAL